MSENIRQIAMRISEARNICGYSVETMAQSIGISAEEYRRYESGDYDIPISVLCEIALKCKVEVTALITGEEPKLHAYTLTRSGKGVPVARNKNYNYFNLAHQFLQKRIEPFLVTVEPKAEHTPISLNSHPGQEFDYILEGSVVVSINHKELTLYEGDSIYFDSSYPHGIRADGDKTAKFIAIVIT
ncbi:MAG: helix-turn-helix domain-containing protein [Bacillota bacterium]